MRNSINDEINSIGRERIALKEPNDQEEPKRIATIKKVIFIALFVFFLIFATLITFYNEKNKDNSEATTEGIEKSLVSKTIFKDLEEFSVNLEDADHHLHFFKIKVVLEMQTQEALKAIQISMPKIQDVLLRYLHTLSYSDLRNSRAFYRLREDILLRINKIIYPAQITDVLLNHILVQ